MRHELPDSIETQFPYDDNTSGEALDRLRALGNTTQVGMTRSRLQDLHKELCAAALATQSKKNSDYATEEDIFRNFRMFGGLGILVRLSDKVARLRTFEERGLFTVTDESLRDTIEDLINYAVIYYAYKKDGR